MCRRPPPQDPDQRQHRPSQPGALKWHESGQALAGAAGSLSPAALAVVLFVLLPKWARLLSRAVKLLGMLGAVIAGYLLVSNWNEISATLHL